MNTSRSSNTGCIRVLISIAALVLLYGQASAGSSLLTTAEQAVRLEQVNNTLKYVAIPKGSVSGAESIIRRSIQKAQQGEAFFRRPVPLSDIMDMAHHLEMKTGRIWSMRKTAATVDYIHALMREGGQTNPRSLEARIDRSLQVDRKAFHGQVAELREARARGMLLTKNKQSTTFDLTEAKFRPRSAQLKVYQDARAGLSSLKDDLRFQPKRARYGIMPQEQIDSLIKRGKLRLRGIAGGEPVYQPTTGSKVTILSARTVKGASDSHAYAQLGKQGASELRNSTREVHAGGNIWGKMLAQLGLVGSGMLAVDAYGQSSKAWIMWNDPALYGSALPYLQTGLAGGRWVEAGTLGLGSAAELGLLGSGGLRTFGRVAGKQFLLIACGVEGLIAGIAYNEYSTGRISQREFYQRATGPAIFAVFTTGGAIIGGIIGAVASAPTGGTIAPGTVPVFAIVGAQIGAVIAIPFQVGADWTWNWYYRKFNEKQRAAVNRAIGRHYGLAN